MSTHLATPLARAKSERIEVDAGVMLPVAFSGLRRILRELAVAAPAAIDRISRANPAVWNRLFPGTFAGVPALNELALSPSERRLHRESEQVFWILNTSARAILDALRETGATLVVLNAAATELVTLRALMRAREWGRLEGLDDRIVLTGWRGAPRERASLFEKRRTELLASVRARMQVEADDIPAVSARRDDSITELEGTYLATVIDSAQTPDRRIAAAILAVRSCFFSTNYEGAMLACERGLELLREPKNAISAAEVRREFDAFEQEPTTAAIEIDASDLGSVDELQALLLRSAGVVWSFSGCNDEAMDTFGEALKLNIGGERRGQLRMFRALSFIKRMGQLPQARAEAEAGIEELGGSKTPSAALHEGWLRNVLALTHFQGGDLDAAFAQEMKAIHCVGDLHSASATHLKINLITNISAIQEKAKRFTDSIASWRRFERTIEHWDTNFHKHHRYRLAALVNLSGDRDAALKYLEEAYNSATKVGDLFHRQVIASDLGFLALKNNDAAAAADWFAKSADHAREIGDPLKIAETLAGQQVALGKTDFAEARRLANLSTTYPKETARFVAAVDAGTPAAVQAVLPPPRTKLNRPFDLANLY